MWAVSRPRDGQRAGHNNCYTNRLDRGRDVTMATQTSWTGLDVTTACYNDRMDRGGT